MHIFDNLVADILWEEGQSFCTPQRPNHRVEVVAGEWKQVLLYFFSFSDCVWAHIFSAPAEAEPSIIVPDGGDGMDTGCVSLDGANLPLGERLVMDAAAALVRDENN